MYFKEKLISFTDRLRDDRSVNFRFYRAVIRFLFWICSLIPGIKYPINASVILVKISKLEAKGEYERARSIRSNALKNLPSSCLGPLWRSEGEDKLYKLKDYKGALDAFVKSLKAMEHSGGMFCGVTSPDRVYYGAAASSIMLGNFADAEKYYKSFVDFVEKLSKNSELDLEWQTNCVKDLESQIYGHIDKKGKKNGN